MKAPSDTPIADAAIGGSVREGELTPVSQIADVEIVQCARRLERDRAKLRQALSVLLSHYDKEGNRIPTEQFMRDVVCEARVALAVTEDHK